MYYLLLVCCKISFIFSENIILRNGKYLCVHGGLSPKIKTIDSITNVERQVEIPEDGPLCDLLWSDPVETENGKFATNNENDFIKNNKRSCSYFFGKKAANKFLEKN